jgi:hypothetical protein
MKYVYYISYAHRQGFGYNEVTLDHKLESSAQVEQVAIQVCSHMGYDHTPIILNFQLLRME